MLLRRCSRPKAMTAPRSATSRAQSACLPGSLYYHFKSKEDLLVAVYRKGVGARSRLPSMRRWAAPEAIRGRRSRRPARRTCPLCWTAAIMPGSSDPESRLCSPPPEMLPVLNAERDRYERHFEKLIAALPLDPSLDRWLFKVALFGSLNWSQTWYRKGRYTPAEIAAAFIAMLRADPG